MDDAAPPDASAETWAAVDAAARALSEHATELADPHRWRDTLGGPTAAASRLDYLRTAVDPQLDQLRRGLVAQLRAQGETWDAIGKALGVTRQAAWERFGQSR